MNDVIELAKQAGFQKFLKPEDRSEMICDPATLERFYALVRNAALEKAIAKVTENQILSVVAVTECLAILESLKEPTP